MILAIWLVALLLLGLWSLAGWGLHALLVSGVQWVGDLKPLLAQLPFAAFIERWVPGWQDGLRWTLDLMQAALGWLGGAAPLLVWLVWAVGALLLLLVALVITGVVALVRKSTPPPPTASA